MKQPFSIGIGGAHSDIGKTTLAVALLKHITSQPPFYPFSATPRTGAIKYEKTALYSSITDDKAILSIPDKDTGRLLLAGAEEVLWVQSPPDGLEEVLPIAFDRLSHLDCVIIEGNSAIEFLKPDIVIFLIGESREEVKPSARGLLEKADILVTDSLLENSDEWKDKKILCVNPSSSLHIKELINSMEKTAKQKDIEKVLTERAVDSCLACGIARGIAEELGVAYGEVGSAANGLKIKIKNCELGCF